MKPQSTPLVFVVDDDLVFNTLIKQVLKKYGVVVETFQSSESLFARIQQRTPDLCIIDLNLGPVVKGWDLIPELRQATHPRLPIVIASTINDTASLVQAIELGANDYLLKPLDREVMVAKLMRFFTTEEFDLYTSGNATTKNQAEIDTLLSLDAQLAEVDEAGFTLVSRHLISRGTALALSGPSIAEISGQDKPLLVTVVSASLDPATDTYTIYLEFDAANERLNQHVRAWLSRPPTP